MILKNTNNIFNRFIKIMMVLLLVFSGALSSIVNTPLHAETVKLEKGEPIYYPSWLGNWSTNYYYINGQLAYCLNSSRNEPVNNNSAHAEISNNMALLKVLYYGYGGPEDYFKNDHVSSEKTKYLYTHIMASFAYSGDIYGGKDWDYLESIGVGLKGVYNWIQAQPVPSNEFNFDGSNNLNVTAYYDSNTGNQRTKDIKFNSTSSNTVTLPLQNGVKLHNVTKGTISSGNVTINGGDTFYLETDMFTKRGDFSSGTLSGSHKTRYAPLIVKSDSTSVQDIGSWSFTYDPTQISLNVKWTEGAQFSINKKDNYNETVKNATFTLKEWNKYSSTYTDLKIMSYDQTSNLYNSGILTKTDTNLGKFKIVENVPSGYTSNSRYEQEFEYDGYILRNTLSASLEGTDVEIQISSLFADKHQIKYEVYNVPDNINQIQFPTWSDPNGQDDLNWVNLVKDSNGLWQTTYHMSEDANYQIHCYFSSNITGFTAFATTNFDQRKDVVIDAINTRILGNISIKKNDENKKALQGVKFNIIANEDIRTPQGTIVYNNGDIVEELTTDVNGTIKSSNLDLGSYIVRETSTLDGYILADDQIVNLTNTDPSVEIVQNEIELNNYPNKITLKKIDKDTKQPLEGAFFDLYKNINGYWVKQQTNLKSNQDGLIEINRLATGDFYFVESRQPDGYKIDTNEYHFSVGQNGKIIANDIISVDSNGNGTIIIENELDLTSLKIIKKNDNDKLLENAEFTLYSDKECTIEIANGKSDKNGEIFFKNIQVGDFYLKETKAPSGYRKIEDPLKISLKMVDGKFTLMINGEIKNDKDNFITQELDNRYIGTVTIINKRGFMLPATGSNLTIIIICCGSIVTGLAIKKRREKNE
ncbi:MAG: SpaA isopeptide-forming pilin-related protein [Thomasclavelia ramosa]